MQCPYCQSTQVRKAAAVYEDGTQTSTMRTRGLGAGLGLGGARGGGVGLFASRGTGRSTTLAARKADKARPVWIGLRGGIALFLALCVIFAPSHLDNPFGDALALTLALMVIVPAATAIRAELRNKDYDRRWHCQTCGELWTRSLPKV